MILTLYYLLYLYYTVDAAFSPSGRYIAVAVRSAGDCSQVSSAAVLIFQAESSAAGEPMKLLCKQAVPEVLAVRWAGNVVISASGRGAVASCVDYGLTVWHCAAEDGNSSAGLRNVQTVTVQLPRSAQGQDSSCLLNPLLDCALSLETLTQQKQQRYLMLTSRRSNFVACSPRGAAPVPHHLSQPARACDLSGGDYSARQGAPLSRRGRALRGQLLPRVCCRRGTSLHPAVPRALRAAVRLRRVLQTSTGPCPDCKPHC